MKLWRRVLIRQLAPWASGAEKFSFYRAVSHLVDVSPVGQPHGGRRARCAGACCVTRDVLVGLAGMPSASAGGGRELGRA